MRTIDELIEKILITNEEINTGIKKAANWINKEYKDKTPILLGILKGCVPFFGSLLPHLNIRCSTEFMSISSFQGGIKALSEPKIILDMNESVYDRDVLIVEDIIDTAKSLKKIKSLLLNRGAKSVKIVTLVDKYEGRKVELDADYSCFKIPNVFIVGFGLDYQEELRNLPFIGVLKKEIYTKED